MEWILVSLEVFWTIQTNASAKILIMGRSNFLSHIIFAAILNSLVIVCVTVFFFCNVYVLLSLQHPQKNYVRRLIDLHYDRKFLP